MCVCVCMYVYVYVYVCMYVCMCVYVFYLLCSRSRYADSQAATSDGRDDLTSGVATQDETTGCRVLFHGPSQRVLGLSRQLIHLHQ